jgi:hypothetical protein
MSTTEETSTRKRKLEELDANMRNREYDGISSKKQRLEENFETGSAKFDELDQNNLISQETMAEQLIAPHLPPEILFKIFD